MDASSSAELQNFLEEEKKRAMFHQMVSKATEECWDKCITSTPGSKFSSSESTCLSNCAKRYLDMSAMLVQILQRFQPPSGGGGF